MTAAAETVGAQAGLSPEMLEAQQQEAQQDAEMAEYRQKVEKDEKRKLAALRTKMAALTGEMQQASQQRQQRDQEYQERVTEQMAGPQPATQQEAQEQAVKANKQKELIEKQRGAAKKEMGKQKG